MSDPLDLIDQWGPEKVVLVSDRRSGMRGVLVIDNTSRGVGKGGTRMSPTLTVAEVARLARTMTWKWAAVDLYHGGAKAGILGDPRAANKEQILRAFARALAKEVPADYVFGLDMGLAEEDAAIFVDELNERGVSTGLPQALGGLPYDQLGVTGFGVAEVADAAATVIDLDLQGARVAIQGFGAVGRAAATRLHELGAVVVAVSTAAGSVHDPDGLDIAQLSVLAAAQGEDCLTGHRHFSPIADDLLTAEVDILIPAAREDTIDSAVAGATTATLIVEGANLPTTPAAQQILHERGIVVVPDFIANAGGIVAAAHSTDARYSPFTVDPAAVFAMISEKLRGNTVQVLSESRIRASTPRQAAMELAQSRVLAAMTARGFRPARRQSGPHGFGDAGHGGSGLQPSEAQQGPIS
jgi:glutamate dehydrogenase (NAD(P)+)